jgi:hypothetical protein
MVDKKIKKTIGDVIEVPTSKGLAYVQYTHEHSSHPVFGSLVRVLKGFYKERPSKEALAELVKQSHRFQTFCPIHHAVSHGNFELVGNFPVPECAREFPIFKSTAASPKSDLKKVIWWLWDGEKEWKVGELSEEEMRKYPIRGVYNNTGLVGAIEKEA